MQEIKTIITFNSVTDIMSFEKKCKNFSQPGRIIPVPRAISTSCGLCWMALPEEETLLREFCQQQNIKPAGWYKVLL